VTPSPARGAAEVLEHARAHPARLGSTRLICVDGPSGSGKTTLARQVADLAGAPLVRLDDLYPGWDGLFAVEPVVLALLRPLATGRPGSYRRYDWHAQEHREEHRVDPAPVLVLEGVGSGNRAWRDRITTLVWVEAPAGERLARAVARDGEDAREHLLAWAADEERWYAEQGTRASADLVVDTRDDPG
jgi:uridine kinase